VHVDDSPPPATADVPASAHRALARYAGLESTQISRITRGLIHETFFVESNGRRDVLQRVNPVFSPSIHENIAAVTARLEARGVPTPLLRKTVDGALYADLGTEGRWRLMSHVQGFSFDTCDSTANARSAGALVGRFHSALEDLRHDFRPLGFAFHEPSRHFADLEAALVRQQDHRLHADVSIVAGAVRRASAAWVSLDGVPDRVVHLDLKFNNVLFAEGEDGNPSATALIDLDTLSRRPLWVELGDAWRSWCNRRREHEPTAELDPRVFEASADGWLGALEMALSREELESLAHGVERLTIELCARFCADALEEQYFGWNRDLFETAGDHNLARARGQLSLHDQARETREDRRRFLLG
jgi:Ser/Thr protein kinase RdoA (MazF antagonist)